MMKFGRAVGGRVNIFTKIMIVIVLLLVPIVMMYNSSNKISTGVVERELLQVNLNRLRFFVDQMDTEVDRLWRAAFVIAREPDVVQLQFRSSNVQTYSRLEAKKLLQEKLDMQSTTLAWTNKLTVFSPPSGIAVSTNWMEEYNEAYFENAVQDYWDYRLIETERGEEKAFVRHLILPFTPLGKPENPNLYVEVTFSTENLVNMLERFMQGSGGKPFLYNPGFETIQTHDSDKQLIGEMTRQFAALKQNARNKEGSIKITFHDEPYLVNYAASAALGWYLVDFVPMKKVLQPIDQSKRIFYGAGLLLLVLGVAAAALLYRNVQRPIYELIRAVKSLRRGEYGHRIEREPQNEFHYLIEQFNLMSDDIQTLIDKVYIEELRAKESSLKHLQAQINPHFLYNNFAYIQSMAQLDRTKAIVAFTQHLSQYYRYTTKTEQQLTFLAEEMDLLRNYLEIHRMQSERLRYDEHIEEGMMQLLLPRLLLQPLVENAIVHGMGGRKGECRIIISGYRTENGCELAVEDNGIGMKQEALAALRSSLQQSTALQSLGLWNVHQRLRHYFGPLSGLHIDHSALGGLRARLVIIKEGGESHH
ncbi:histidine kinase [Paenibacillus sp. CF384]|uniref:sensor histidine kinase n=1 Tax=Paenibacillus sp. CF384 TaxID=1884382 RepID=UPI000895F73B|nr:histidine kinase [Paenibacillus sp. CF384]SDW91422.1 two-component system, sensor histidine kinase YesM [Paenibacillus sp. CF384]